MTGFFGCSQSELRSKAFEVLHSLLSGYNDTTECCLYCISLLDLEGDYEEDVDRYAEDHILHVVQREFMTASLLEYV